MLERTGDLWAAADADPTAWVVVPTNGALSPRTGELVMGAGVARSARDRYPGLAAALGEHVRAKGNTPVACEPFRVLTWPTKPGTHELDGRTHPGWMCGAKVRTLACTTGIARLLWASTPLVLAEVDRVGPAGPVLMPRIGCGLGGLDWTKVGPALHRVLDDRFVVLHPDPE